LVSRKRAIGALVVSAVLVVALGLVYFASPSGGPVAGPTPNPCQPVSIQVPNSNGAGYELLWATTVSYHFFVKAPNGTVTQQGNICNKSLVNAGYDQLSKVLGDNATGGPVYLIASTDNTSPGASDTSCPGALTSTGFTVYNGMAHYKHTAGTSTYTLSAQWTSSDVTTITILKSCLTVHSSGGTLVDETNNLNGGAGYVVQDGYIYNITATITP
jgi:hypothetical protein